MDIQTVITPVIFAKLANNKNVSVQAICDIIFSEFLVYQDNILKEKILLFKESIPYQEQHVFDSTKKEIEEQILTDVTHELKDVISQLIKQYTDNILDAKNENLITIQQMEKLLVTVNNIQEAVILDM